MEYNSKKNKKHCQIRVRVPRLLSRLLRIVPPSLKSKLILRQLHLLFRFPLGRLFEFVDWRWSRAGFNFAQRLVMSVRLTDMQPGSFAGSPCCRSIRMALDSPARFGYQRAHRGGAPRLAGRHRCHRYGTKSPYGRPSFKWHCIASLGDQALHTY